MPIVPKDEMTANLLWTGGWTHQIRQKDTFTSLEAKVTELEDGTLTEVGQKYLSDVISNAVVIAINNEGNCDLYLQSISLDNPGVIKNEAPPISDAYGPTCQVSPEPYVGAAFEGKEMTHQYMNRIVKEAASRTYMVMHEDMFDLFEEYLIGEKLTEDEIEASTRQLKELKMEAKMEADLIAGLKDPLINEQDRNKLTNLTSGYIAYLSIVDKSKVDDYIVQVIGTISHYLHESRGFAEPTAFLQAPHQIGQPYMS
ncbi:MAG: hypothetical protein KKF44_00635 [Nanoarchaeota archaeon]|nr:hypothetical protein [Nanoarchaeota archaeon]